MDIPIDTLRSYYEQDDLERLYEEFLRIYRDNTDNNELEFSIKQDIQKTLLYAPDFDTILERLVSLIDMYHQYFQA